LHESVLRARDRALDEQKIVLGVHLEDGEPELGDALPAHAAGELDALEHARRRRRRTDRARLADVVRAVAARAGAEVVALDRALEALADPDAGDLDLVTRLEGLDGDRLAFDGAVDPAAELDELAVRADVELLQVAELRPGQFAVCDGVERELHRVVAVHVLRPDLDDGARAG